MRAYAALHKRRAFQPLSVDTLIGSNGDVEQTVASGSNAKNTAAASGIMNSSGVSMTTAQAKPPAT